MDPKGPSDRSFDISLAIVFAVAGLAPLRHGHGAMRLWALGTSAVLLAIAIVRPSLLHVLNQLGTRVGLLLHRLVSSVLMAVLFYTVITPMGLVLRWSGKNLLQLGFDRARASYWIERRRGQPAPGAMSRQF